MVITFLKLIERRKPEAALACLSMSKIKLCKRPDLCHLDDYMECVTIEVENKSFNMDKNMIVSVIYRPPNTETGVFVETINAFIEKIKPENKYCYLMGDYNINILNFATHSATADFVDSMYPNGFFPLINWPTRITTSSATIIDSIFTNSLFHAGASCQGILVTDISDHLPIFHINCCGRITQEYLYLRETFLSIIDNPFRMP